MTAIKRGEDGLTSFCRDLLIRTRRPRSAGEIVTEWYAHWRGRKDKPKTVVRKMRGRNVDRVSAWLRTHAKAGRLVAVDQKGAYGATRYEEAPGANWKRGKAAVAVPDAAELGDNLLAVAAKSQAL